MTSLLGYLESSIGHPSLWLGAYDADHPALSLHYKNSSCRASAAAELECPPERQVLSSTTELENRERQNCDNAINEKARQDDAPTPDTKQADEPAPAPAPKKLKKVEREEAKKDPAYTLFSPEQAEELVQKTEERVEGLLSTSAILRNQKLEKLVPTFTLGEDIHRGARVGVGGFAMIYKACVKDPQRLLNHHQQQNKENCEYVIKHLSPDLVSQERKLHIGMRDFVMESYLMAKLDHPHILKLVGSSKGGIANFGVTLRTDAFFMVLPKLNCTLTEKLKEWKEEAMAHKQRPKLLDTETKSFTRSWSTGAILARQRILREAEQQQRQTENFYHRLQVVVDLLSALEYLHSMRLFHRGKNWRS